MFAYNQRSHLSSALTPKSLCDRNVFQTKMSARRRCATALGCFLLLNSLFANLAYGQSEPWSFDPKAYQSLVDADSPQTIPPGTRIGVNNWQQYRNFLPIGVQALFSRAYHWSIPKGPDGEMVVGASVVIPSPYTYSRDTEKYAGSTTLHRAADGRITFSGYVAGLPFPELLPGDSNLVYKLIDDAYFHYHPAILTYRQHAALFDTYLNRTDTEGNVLEFRLNHISDEGYPLAQPLAPAGVFFTSNVTVEAPEQTKYTVNLLMYYDNPDKIEDIYTYLPSLRRSIRRSSAARCSPLLGTDIVQDDSYPRPILVDQFSYKLLGRKKLLFQAHMDTRYLFDEKSYNITGIPGWPKPLVGPWELRTVWVIEERTLPSNPDYCYGDRVSYVDENFFSSGMDIFDRGLKLWKVLNAGLGACPIGDGHGSVYEVCNTRTMMVDLIASHATVAMQVAPGQVNGQVPAKYRDVHTWALPAGLPQVNR